MDSRMKTIDFVNRIPSELLMISKKTAMSNVGCLSTALAGLSDLDTSNLQEAIDALEKMNGNSKPKKKQKPDLPFSERKLKAIAKQNKRSVKRQFKGEE